MSESIPAQHVCVDSEGKSMGWFKARVTAAIGNEVLLLLGRDLEAGSIHHHPR